MRTVNVLWICSFGHRNSPEDKKCWECGALRAEKCAQVHTSERAVMYINPATGERRTPARADQPMPEVYSKQGFERVEIMNMTQFEKQTGVVHEATSFNPGNEPAVDDPRETVNVPKGVEDALCRDMADAIASGPWTGLDSLV